MLSELVVVGIGGFGREALSVALAAQRVSNLPYTSIAAVDDQPTSENLERLARMGVPFLGSTQDGLIGSDCHFVVGVGNPGTRAQIVENLVGHGLEAATLIHPTAVVGEDSSVGPGSIVCAGVHISVNVRLGRHTHLNPASVVGHDTVLDDFVSVNPNATVSGDVRIGSRAVVGAGAVVLQGLTIGAGSLVGAAACVVRNVPDGATVMGVPAR